jgi:hypothetical protein
MLYHTYLNLPCDVIGFRLQLDTSIRCEGAEAETNPCNAYKVAVGNVK